MSKWDNYTIGKIPWINSRRERIKTCPFIQHACRSLRNTTILEVGGGELIEAQEIKKLRPDIYYQVVDVSKTFIDNAKGVVDSVLWGDFEKIHFDVGCFYNIIYMNHVLEHMENVSNVINKVLQLGESYHITMFKWRFYGGGLKSKWDGRNGYWSTAFNIYDIIKCFGDTVSDIYITDKDNKKYNWDVYRKKMKSVELHRDRNHYLHLEGNCELI
jgi:hypothetical protein